MIRKMQFFLVVKALRYPVLLFLLVLFLTSSSIVYAQNDLSFVYGTNHFDGAAYNSTFVPPSVDTMYLIADNTSMLASRYTNVYYWPLTNELKPDWDEANVVVQGQLEILKNGSLFESIEMTNYVIQYDAYDRIDTLQLYLGEDAVAARQNFEYLQDQYREDLYTYYEKMDAYRQVFQTALAELQAGNITEDEMPEPPEPQKDLSLFSSNLLVGFPINLPEGTYTLQLRLPNGSIQRDSQKKLVVFSSIQEGIGYNVITEERWTAPEESKEANEVIYGLAGTRLYLEPFYQIEFNELYYTRMNNPQDKQARQDRNVWVPFDFASETKLKIDIGNRSELLTIEDYFVRQLVGNTLGYEILSHDPTSDRSVSFSGFQIDVDVSEIHIQLLDEVGNPLPYSQRELRILNVNRSIWIYVLSSLPLLAGALFVLLRRNSVNTKNISE